MRFLSRFSIKRIPYLFAFLLPPQVQDLSWTWEEQGKSLKVARARSQTILNTAPFFHRFIEWTPQGELRYPDAASGEWFQLDPRSTRVRAVGGRWSVAELLRAADARTPETLRMAGLAFRVSEDGRRLELLDPKSPSQSAWTMDLQTRAARVEWRSDGRDFFYGLARETREIFVVTPRSLRSVRHIRWDADVEIVDIVACPGREQLLVEQPFQKDLTRVVRLREWTPVNFTIFDLSQGQEKSEAVRALSQDCRAIYFAGPRGLQKVQY